MSRADGQQNEGKTAAPVLERYAELRCLRVRPRLQILSARDDEGEGVVIVRDDADTPSDSACAAFARLAEAHRRVDDPQIPAVREAGPGFVVFACPVLLDGQAFLERLVANGRRLSYQQSDTLLTNVRIAMQVAHRVQGEDGQPICLGRMAPANIWLTADGRQYLWGLGHNAAVLDAEGRRESGVLSIQAPEVETSGQVSPLGDYIALLKFARSLAYYGEMPPIFTRLLAGDVRREDVELVEAVQWLERNLINAFPHQRATFEEGLARSARVRELLGSRLDQADLQQFLTKLLAGYEAPRFTGSGPVDASPQPKLDSANVWVATDGAWIDADNGARTRLGAALRRIVLLLVRLHAERTGRAASLHELVSAGWPAEQMHPDSARNRVHVALSKLRKLGLGNMLERFDTGYRLSPDARVRGDERAKAAVKHR